MPLVTSPPTPGRLGFLLPPMPPVRDPGAGGNTSSTTSPATGAPTFGSTAWVTALAASAEDAGAAGVWATDHLFWRRPGAECLTTLAVAAAATRSAVVGSCVLQLPLRAPAAVAKQAASLQALSGGRFVLGVGVGSHLREYELAGVPFGTRGQALDTGITAMRAAWRTADGRTSDGRTADGADGPDGDYRLEPPGPVPLWVGGTSPRAVRRAATVADGWVPLFLAPDQFSDALANLRATAAQAGRSPEAVVAATVVTVTVGDDPAAARATGARWLGTLYGIPDKAFERHVIAGPATRCAAGIARYVAAGAAHVIVMVAADDAIGQFRALAAAYDRLGPAERPGVDARAREMAPVGA